ncbi:RimJ/RimL family protein N-acetyltransferase [Antricoccus suffuscus]|uniref:RimJ/RimL family protein N-acetyltransferase n=2 Tax=Antricoccus suffuscus TaxID=1629062 RepID=A0A2T1A2G8_9ACTN|nr:RimJ/RimL family protein N-acetyltransferase [Antricoccus suffuscus]
MHGVIIEESSIHTPRLTLRPWTLQDAPAALAIYGTPDVSRWLAPAMQQVPDIPAMEEILERWISECDGRDLPEGRWAIELRETGELVGGIALLPMPPYHGDLEIAWQLAPRAWGKGLAAEAGHAVAHQAFESGALIDELFAVVRPRNVRGAATAKSVGMEWVGETDKYYDLQLQVYRLRKADLDVPTEPRRS